MFPEVRCPFDKRFLLIRDLKTTRAVIPVVRRRRGRSAPPANQLITAVRSKSTFSVSVPVRHTEPVFMGSRCLPALPLMSESLLLSVKSKNWLLFSSLRRSKSDVVFSSFNSVSVPEIKDGLCRQCKEQKQNIYGSSCSLFSLPAEFYLYLY